MPMRLMEHETPRKPTKAAAHGAHETRGNGRAASWRGVPVVDLNAPVGEGGRGGWRGFAEYLYPRK